MYEVLAVGKLKHHRRPRSHCGAVRQ
jgi:hypothetical protein